MYLLKENYALGNLTVALEDDNENYTVWYSTRMLKYMSPSLYHCYYAGKETYNAYVMYEQIDTY